MQPEGNIRGRYLYDACQFSSPLIQDNNIWLLLELLPLEEIGSE